MGRTVARVTGNLTARSAGLALVAFLPLGFFAVFFAWPVVAIVGLGITGGVGEGADVGVLVVLSQPQTWQVAGFTLAQAAASTALALLAGLPVAFLLARVRLPGVGVARALILVPFVLPTVVVGLAFRALWPSGGVGTIVLANAFFNVAVVARTVRACGPSSIGAVPMLPGPWAHPDGVRFAR